MENTLLATAYLPPIEHFTFLMQEEIWLEQCELFQKQSYRNRAYIQSGNGKQILSIPIVNGAGVFPIQEARIDYKTPWQRNHWRSIASAYGNSPYFLYYQDALKPFYEKEYEFLFDFNLQLMQTILRLMRTSCNIQLTTKHEPERPFDLRTVIHPKKSFKENYPLKLKQPYYQVFEDRYGFEPNLSIIDLLFNLGPDTPQYLRTNLKEYEKFYHTDE